MVKEFVDTNLEAIYLPTQQNTSGHLSWKFFENDIQLNGQLSYEEEAERQNNYAEDLNSTKGLILLSNSNLYQSSNNQHNSSTIMNSSLTATTGNHHHNTNNNNNNNNINNNNNNSSSNTINTNNHQHSINLSGHRNDTAMMNTGNGGNGGTSTAIGHNGQGIQHHSTGQNGVDINGCSGGISASAGFYLGLYGWRKKCLYILILGLMILIIVNLVLTLWILKVMEFSSEGMGQLKIVAGGIQLSGQALIMDLLRASAIRSRHGQPISIESSRNFSINTRDSGGFIENHLFLGHDRLECLANGFRINDTHGGNLFSVNRNEVAIGAHTLKIDGEGGAIFRESIQTSHVRADAGRELRLESPTRQLEITAAQDVILQSRAGNLEINALKEIKLNSIAGSIRLDSSHIVMPNLKTAQPPSPGTTQNREHNHRVYQLCACFNGKLFLASPHSICAGDDTTVCR